MKVIWIETDKHVYGTIYREHHEEFGVFGSFTDTEGCREGGNGKPQIYTEWGFKGADCPIIRSIGTKENREQKQYDYKYFIAVIGEGE